MKTSISHVIVLFIAVVSLIGCSEDEISYPKDGMVHLNCVDDFTTEFPFSKSLQGTMVSKAEYVESEIVFNDDGTFCISYREECSDPLMGRYCGMTEGGTFSLKMEGVWGPHTQTITERNSLSNCNSISGEVSYCDDIFTYNELAGETPITVFESTYDHYKGRSGTVKYAMECYPIKGTPPYPPYKYFREVVVEFEDDPYDLMIVWQSIYKE